MSPVYSQFYTVLNPHQLPATSPESGHVACSVTFSTDGRRFAGDSDFLLDFVGAFFAGVGRCRLLATVASCGGSRGRLGGRGARVTWCSRIQLSHR